MSTLSNANTTAQWYEDSYLGGYQPRLEKAVLHSTETRSWPGYGGGASAPNVTYHPLVREFRQHFSNDRSARALRDPFGTAVRENRDGVWQLEIIAYSDHALARRVGGMWIGDLREEHYEDIAGALIELNEKHGLPLHSEVEWREGQKTYVSGVRLSGSQFDRARGILGHMHVSGNTHWDVGGFYWSRLQEAIDRGGKPEEDDMKDDERDALFEIRKDARELRHGEWERPVEGGEWRALKFLRWAWYHAKHAPERVWDFRWPWRRWIAEDPDNADLVDAYPDGYTMKALLQNSYGYLRRMAQFEWWRDFVGNAIWSRQQFGDGPMHAEVLEEARRNSDFALQVAQQNQMYLLQVMASMGVQPSEPPLAITLEPVRTSDEVPALEPMRGDEDELTLEPVDETEAADLDEPVEPSA